MRRTHLYSDRVRILLLLVLLGSLSALFIEIALQSSQLLGNYVAPRRYRRFKRPIEPVITFAERREVPMINLRWYTAQVERLPEAERRQLTQQLRKAARRGDLPSKREWKYAIQRANRFSFS